MTVIRATQETKKMIATSEQKESFWSWLFSK
ncbi:DUF3967 domain-containing protein [Bacillus sp. S14(2024)]